MATPKYILAIVFESENNTLLSGTWAYARPLIEQGHTVIIIDLKQPEFFQSMYKMLAAGEVHFAFALQGVGSQLKVQNMNLWTAAQTPFISLHFDHPSHCIQNHISDSPYIVNLYSYESFLETFQKFVLPIRNEKRLYGRVEIKSNPPAPAPIPFDERPLKYLYLKTGLSTKPYAQHFNTLPPDLRDGVWDRLNTVHKDPNLSLCELAASLFPADSFFNPDNQVEFWAIVRAMDLYIRSQRAIDFVNWLKFQDGAIIIGNGWDAIDKTGAKATFKPSIDSTQLLELYHRTQFVCNTNPYGADMVHERVIMGLFTGCGVITDTNAWTDTNMAHIPNLIRFTWDHPLGPQIEPHVADTAHFSQGGEESRSQALTLFSGSDNAAAMVEYAAQARLLGKTTIP